MATTAAATVSFTRCAVSDAARVAAVGAPLSWEQRVASSRSVALVSSSGRHLAAALRVRAAAPEEDAFVSSQKQQQQNQLSRRASLVIGTAAATGLLANWVAPSQPAQAGAFILPPDGFRLYTDRFDGYSFFYPDSWVEVRGSGQDCFFRSARNLDENVSVEVSSPTSSRFTSVRDLGDPNAAGRRLEAQLLTEFMSTRLGVRREAVVLAASGRVVGAGTARRGAGEEEEDTEYYDVELNVKSYANNNQLAIMPDERVQVLEWNRHYVTVLGVANNRLYQLRMQVPERLYEAEKPILEQVASSFRVFNV